MKRIWTLIRIGVAVAWMLATALLYVRDVFKDW